jgi:FkbM family methyltransferase
MFRSTPAHTRKITEEDIRFCYNLFLHRDPDDVGLAHYRERMAAGATLEQIIRSFMWSDEFLMKVARHLRDDITEVDLGGYAVTVHRFDSDFGNAIVQSRQYEEQVRKAVREHLRAGDVFVDIGANVGVMALLAGTIVGPAGRVIAIEPEPENLQMLYRGIVINELANVEVWPFPASDKRQVFSLGGLSNGHIEASTGSAQGISRSVATDAGAKLVQSVALDELLGELPRLDCVKIDIEGHEPAATDGFWKNITRHRPVLIVEWNPRTLQRARADMAAYAAKLLTLYPSLRVTSAFGDDLAVTNADELVRFWTRRDAELTAAGRIAAGLLHFDLIAARSL